jgi:ferric-dicitrate binding protein FerR (iron transport regulator)
MNMADGSTVRFNCATDAVLEDQRSFQISGGQMWSTVAKAESPFRVQAAGATVTAVGTQFDVQCEARKATVRVAEGSTRVAAKDAQVKVDAGQMVHISDGSVGKVDRTYDLLVATRWVNELLVLKGRDSQELNRRVNDMLAQLGETKVRELYEDEIRSLGDHCVIPLARYLESDRSLGAAESEKRQRASRILSDLAQPWAIPDLIKLLEHSDGQVRSDAARALERLTGQDQGIRPEQWKNGAGANQQGHERWQRWWQENRQRYPSGPLVNE